MVMAIICLSKQFRFQLGLDHHKNISTQMVYSFVKGVGKKYKSKEALKNQLKKTHTKKTYVLFGGRGCSYFDHQLSFKVSQKIQLPLACYFCVEGCRDAAHFKEHMLKHTRKWACKCTLFQAELKCFKGQSFVKENRKPWMS